jgi:GWxTD domain-containing protein
VLPLAAAILATSLLGSACSGGGRGTPAPPGPGAGGMLVRPLEIYRNLGLLTGDGGFPAVASFATVAGPADSTFVLLGVSIPNNALRFLREADGFAATYDVTIEFAAAGPAADSQPVRRVSARELVRVPSFAETTRSEESVVFQHAEALQPGRYIVRVDAADVNSSRGFALADTLLVPAYGAAAVRLSAPTLVHEGTGRTDRDEPPRVIMNPRHTVAYGSTAPLLYIESYGAQSVADVTVSGHDGTEVWRTRAQLDNGEAGLHFALLQVPAGALPLGQFWIDVAEPGTTPQRTALVMTISDQWMVANFDDVLQFLRYIAHTDEMEELRAGTPAERRDAWDAFWSRRDPVPASGVNEFREAFFERVRYATEAFREPARPGWQTQRGEVFIVLGPPDQVMERVIGRSDIGGRPNAEEWLYRSPPAGRLNLLFHDRGFGHLDLVPASMSAFRNAADRMKPRGARRSGSAART